MTQDTNQQERTDYLLTQSKVFCMAPWIHMHVWPNGRAFPCCLAEHMVGEYGNTNQQTLKELWNSELATALRRNMLSDKPSKACVRCYELEKDSDAYTLRINLNNKFGSKHFDKVIKTHSDGTHDEVNFSYMDFRFSNLCNMSCRSCSPTFSTQWYDDYIKEYGYVDPSDAEQKYIQLKNKPGFMNELWPLLDTVEEVYWAGGEPLVTGVHWDIMNHWVETGQSETMTINYTTNFSQLYYKRQCVLDLWKKFKSVSVAASLDGAHERGEWIRKGTIWKNIVANRQLMLEQTPHIPFQITPTCSMMNVHHLPDFHREWVELGFVDPHNVRINNLLHPKYYCMQVLPSYFKDEVSNKWYEHIEWITNHERYNSHDDWASSAYGLIDFLNKQDHSDQLKNTNREFNRWDRVRNENWRDILPELAFVDEYKDEN